MNKTLIHKAKELKRKKKVHRGYDAHQMKSKSPFGSFKPLIVFNKIATELCKWYFLFESNGILYD
jgi:hypothetical protein